LTLAKKGNKLIEITNDPMRFNATREAGNADSSVFWGKDFLLVNVDDGDVPVSIDLRPGSYNATQLASEVERAINNAYGDDNKLQVRSNVDDTLTVDFYTLNTGDGTLSGLTTPVSIDLLSSSYVTEQVGIETSGSSPDFTREEFLAHAQVRVIDTMNDYVIDGTGDLGVNGSLFTRSSGGQMATIYEKTDVITFDYASASPSGKRHLAYSYYDKTPALSVYDNKEAVATGKSIVYDSSNNLLRIDLNDTSNFTVGEVVKLAGNFENQDAIINGRSLTILSIDADKSITINTTGEGFPDGGFTLQQGAATSGDTFKEAYILSDESTDVEAFFEGEHLSPAGAVNSYNNKKIVLRETSSATHSYKHNQADAGAINVSGAGSLTSGSEYYVTDLGTSEFNNATDVTILAASKDLNNGSAGLGTIFKANVTTLAGTGRVKPVTSAAENATNNVTIGKTYKVVAGTITHNSVDYAAGTTFTAVNANAITKSGTSGVATTVTGAATTAVAAGIVYTVGAHTVTYNGVDYTAGQKFTGVSSATTVVNKVTGGSNNATITTDTAKFITHDEVFSGLTSAGLGGSSTLASLGMDATNFSNKTVWVDEKNPPIKVSYDAVNQRFEFGVNHTAIGPGTDSNFRAFKVYGASDADGTNNLGIPASDSSPQTTISSTAVIAANSFVADGGEMQINAKRFGASVAYNSDTKTFTFLSGTTGETISADGALGVDVDQNASNIQVGRYSISATDGSVVNASFDTATRYMGVGDNGLMGVGASKNDTIFETARGLASEPARRYRCSSNRTFE
jgi:flagellar hook protein FlgE